MIHKGILRDAGISLLRRRPEIFDAWPISFVWPNPHQARIGDPGDGVDAIAVRSRRDVIEDTVPAGLEFGIMRQDERRPFKPIAFRIIAHQMAVIVRGPDAMMSIQEQSLSVNGTNAADIPAGTAFSVINDEMIPGIAQRVKQVTLLIV